MQVICRRRVPEHLAAAMVVGRAQHSHLLGRVGLLLGFARWKAARANFEKKKTVSGRRPKRTREYVWSQNNNNNVENAIQVVAVVVGVRVIRYLFIYLFIIRDDGLPQLRPPEARSRF